MAFRMTAGMAILMVLGFQGVASAQEILPGYDGPPVLICSLADVMQCEDGDDGCERLRPHDVGAPDFIRLDLAGKKASVPGSETSTDIERMEIIDDKLFLQGAEDGFESEPDGLGWTMSITKGSLRHVLVGASDEVGYVFFGACTPAS